MILKLTGALLLMAGGCGVGICRGMGAELRRRELEQLKRALMLMYSQTEFGHLCLSEIAQRAAEISSMGIDELFFDFYTRLNDGEGESIAAMWSECVDTLKGKTHLTAGDISCIRTLGDSLGTGDIKRQLSGINSLADYIDTSCAILAGTAGTSLKMCRSMGFLISAFAVILLF